mmetsp:Transcript_105349/g.209366  ORF Transcript_105349/g.209366 Transcript_105349/m.209366 type:complete len:298 (-) Transcript_105349:105-998(-)
MFTFLFLLLASTAAGHKHTDLQSAAMHLRSFAAVLSDSHQESAEGTSNTIILRNPAGGSVVAEQAMIVCNAFAYAVPLDIVVLPTGKMLTEGNPLAYKSCRNLHMPVSEGERFEFKAGQLSVGVFQALHVPKTEGSLLLVPHRRRSDLLSAAFVSHAFVDDGRPQVVAVDAFQGKADCSLKIVDSPPTDSNKPVLRQTREENVMFNSAVSLSPGNYKIELRNLQQKTLAASPLQVPPHSSRFIVVRVGTDAGKSNSLIEGGKPESFPEGLLVFQSNAMPTHFLVAALASVLALTQQL